MNNATKTDNRAARAAARALDTTVALGDLSIVAGHAYAVARGDGDPARVAELAALCAREAARAAKIAARTARLAARAADRA
jgi:hypothetical protein